MMLMSDNSCKKKKFVLLISNLSESKSDQRQKISTFTDRTLYHYVDVLSQYSKRANTFTGLFNDFLELPTSTQHGLYFIKC